MTAPAHPFARNDVLARENLRWLFAGVTLVFHLAGNAHYGFFRDELYFIICGRHPDWGYVDQPPIVPLLSAATQAFGTSLFMLRAIPALFAAGAVFVTCTLVTELGGGRFAQMLASIGVALAPVLASFGMKETTDTPALLLWPAAALCVQRAIARREPRWWLGAGVALGLAFNAKYSTLFFAGALLVALLIGERRALRDAWFVAAVAAGVALALPNALWQIAHGLPMWELLRNGASGKNVVLTPLQFVVEQVLILNPVLSIIWLSGLIWTLRARAARWIGYTYLILVGSMIALHAKNYYPADAYPPLFAAGGCAIEAWTLTRTRLRPLAGVLAFAAGLILIPFAMPVLPVDAFIAYERALHIAPSSSERTDVGILPQDYADMLGWPEMVAAIAQAYARLPPAERSHAAIYTANYGEAAAVDFFGPALALPPASSHHNQYYLWGPRGYRGDDLVLISINVNAKDLGRSFRDVRLWTEYAGAPLARPLERDDPIVVSRGLRGPLDTAWPFTAKLYY